VTLLLAAALWAGAVIAAPALASTARAASPALIASVAIYGLGGLVCHQRVERSFHTANLRWPVCARCTGLYLSAGFGSLLLLVSPRRLRHLAAAPGARTTSLLLTAAAPTLASWSLERLGLIAHGNMLRAVLAAPLGLAVAVLLAYAWQAAGAVRQVR
jgi:uncharacterized membrane protein